MGMEGRRRSIHYSFAFSWKSIPASISHLSPRSLFALIPRCSLLSDRTINELKKPKLQRK